MVFTPGQPFGGGNDYFRPEDMRRAYEQKNPGKNFQDFLNQAEAKYGKGSMDPIRRGLSNSNKNKAIPAPEPKAEARPTPSAAKKLASRAAAAKRVAKPVAKKPARKKK